LVKTIQLSQAVLERCIFKHQDKNIYFVADAYKGSQIRQTVIDFLSAASGKTEDIISLIIDSQVIDLKIQGGSHLIVYVGHDGLMDSDLDSYPENQDNRVRATMILAYFSKIYFYNAIVKARAKPLLWTTGLMAPEAYTLEDAIESWVSEEGDESIRLRAAQAYNSYQRCGLEAAKHLLVSGM
jgi:hypothetical protein